MPLPLAVYPDAEKIAIAYLTPHLRSGFTIDVRGGGGHHVRVRRIGGIGLTPNHDNPVVDVLVWHDTDLLRMAVAQELWAALRAANGDTAGPGTVLYQATTLGPRQMPDPADETKSIAMFTVALITRAI